MRSACVFSRQLALMIVLSLMGRIIIEVTLFRVFVAGRVRHLLEPAGCHVPAMAYWVTSNAHVSVFAFLLGTVLDCTVPPMAQAPLNWVTLIATR